jgi:L-2-hydroxyglutarate oxidase
MIATEFLIIGGGVVGLSIARELKLRNPRRAVTVIEKERMPGMHSSGRNSGVLHSGIYYPPTSLKAQVCTAGAREMADYCVTNRLPLERRGKVLVPVNEADDAQLDVLSERARANGVVVQRLDAAELAKLEPEARSATGEALFVPSTAVGSAAAVMKQLTDDCTSMGIDIRCNAGLARVDPAAQHVTLRDGTRISFGHAINSAGLHADAVAHSFDVGRRYAIVPFKGLYWKLDPAAGIDIRHLIYPVPDLRVPFLGVHTTTTYDGSVYLGPTAVPALGRENYRGLQGVTAGDAWRIAALLVRQYVAGRDGFRRLAWQEGRRYFKRWFAEAARALLPRLRVEHLLACDKAGIRAQLYDREAGRLVNDFVVERGPASTHVLNAISPAWTSAFPFARYVVDQYVEKN